MSSRIPCITKVDKFCYICGSFEMENFRRPINEEFIKTQFLQCYKIHMTNLDKPYLPLF